MTECRLLKDFEITKFLGSGGFGLVFSAKNHLDELDYAIKVGIQDDSKYQKGEVMTFSRLKPHPHLVAYKTSWVDQIPIKKISSLGETLKFDANEILSSKGKSKSIHVFCIQMELCAGDLRSWIENMKSLDEKTNLEFFRQIAQGIKFLHRNQVIHRDIKPDNIFFDARNSKRVKIGDFGVSIVEKKGSGGAPKTAIGTELYWAPEQSTGQYGTEVDVYALGVILLEMFIAPSIVLRKHPALFVKTISEGKLYQKFPSCISAFPKVISVVIGLTQINPQKRMDLDGALKHLDLTSPSSANIDTNATIKEYLGKYGKLDLESDQNYLGIIAEYVKNGGSTETTTKSEMNSVYSFTPSSPTAVKIPSNKYRMMLWSGIKSDEIKHINEKTVGRKIVLYDRLAPILIGRKSGQKLTFLLCEVSLGNVHKSPMGFEHWKKKPVPAGSDTVKGCGEWIPNWSENAFFESGGPIIPKGHTRKDTQFPKYRLPFNEYIVFDTNRVNISNIVEITLQ